MSAALILTITPPAPELTRLRAEHTEMRQALAGLVLAHNAGEALTDDELERVAFLVARVTLDTPKGH